MSRLPRLYAPDVPQHIILRGNNRQAIFLDDADYQNFLSMLRDAIREQKVALHAYVLMPNHLHLLATPSDQGALGRAMQSIGRRYVQHFNRKVGRTGTLWEGRYRSTLVDSERYFMLCSRYIELNPVRAELAADPAHFLWSSFRHHVGIASDPLITDHALYWALGNTPFERQAAYRALFEQAIRPEDLKAIRIQTQKGWALGESRFIADLANETNRRALPKDKGRPRGSTRRKASDPEQ